MRNSICPYVFSCKMFVKSDFFVYSPLEHSSDEKKKGLHFVLTEKLTKSKIAAMYPIYHLFHNNF